MCVFKPGRSTRTCRKRSRSAVAEQHARLPDDSGSPDVQAKLMDIIRVQIGQEKVKDFVKEESEKLRQAAEEVGRSSACLFQMLHFQRNEASRRTSATTSSVVSPGQR